MAEQTFDWVNNPQLEIASERTHFTKDFQHPTDPTKRIKIQSSGPLHFYAGNTFRDIPDLPFPEGKEMANTQSQYFVMDLPEWGREEVSIDEKTLRIYDEKDIPIYIFKDPFFTTKSVSSGSISIGAIGEDKLDLARFAVANHKLYLQPETIIKNSIFPLQVFDDTDTASANNKDNQIYSGSADENYGAAASFDAYYNSPGGTMRVLMDWTLSAGSGTISAVNLYLYVAEVSGTNVIDVHELEQATAYVEAEATWNIWKTGSSWAAAGGDYDSETIIDSSTGPAAGNWQNWNLDSISGLTWGTNFDILLKLEGSDTTGANRYVGWRSKEWGTSNQRPYIEITYSAAVAGNSIFFGTNM